MVFDPGDEISRILTMLVKHRLTVKQIVITHAHIDHVGAAARLKEVTGAPVFLNQLDLSLLAMMDMQAGWLGIPTPEVVVPDYSAEEGLKVGIAGLTGVVMHTPGHTEGSICIHFPTQELLIGGDTLFAGSIGRTDLPGGDFKKIIRSLKERLMSLADQTSVIPGHGPATTIGVERETNPFILKH